MIQFEFIDCEIPNFDSEFFVLWIHNVVHEEDAVLEGITYIFCTDDYLLDINQKHLNHDYYTDIISFDYSEDKNIAGDLFISIDRVKDNANSMGISFDEELKRVCVHGVLHLLGYGDKEPEEITLMRDKEDYYIKKSVPRET